MFLKPGLGAAAVAGLDSELRARADVAVVALRTPQQGLAELSAMQGFGPGLAALADNPLPYVLVVTPRAGLDARAGQALVDALRALPAADRVQDNSAWRGRLDALLTLGRRAVLLLGALLALAALLVVGNSVRQDIQAHAEEVAVLRLVGASSGFVRRPYLYAGICYGFGSGVVAVVLALLLEVALAGPVAMLATEWGGSDCISPAWRRACCWRCRLPPPCWAGWAHVSPARGIWPRSNRTESRGSDGLQHQPPHCQ